MAAPQAVASLVTGTLSPPFSLALVPTKLGVWQRELSPLPFPTPTATPTHPS